MAKTDLNLQASEAVVAQMAADIYAAYICDGRVGDDDEATWRKKAIREAILIARQTDATIRSDDEMT